MIVNVLRTTDASPADRFDYWRHTLSSIFVPLDAIAGPQPGFHGELRWADAGAAHLVDVVADPLRVDRTQRLIDRSPSGYYKVCVQIVGRAVLTQGSRTASLGPGDITVYDTDRPYSLTMDTAHHMLVVMCPRTLFRLPPCQLDSVLASRISGRQSMGTLVFAFLSELAAQFDNLTSIDGVRLGENVADLITSLLLEQLAGTRPAIHRGPTLVAQVTGYIEQHLSDPQLSPEQVATAHGYSTRTLQKLFQDNGVTVAGLIRARRLEQCRRALRDPAWDGVSVGVIGAHWGFTNAAHFSRLFKAAFGVSPRAFRLGAEPERTESAQSAQAN